LDKLKRYAFAAIAGAQARRNIIVVVERCSDFCAGHVPIMRNLFDSKYGYEVSSYNLPVKGTDGKKKYIRDRNV
jgi:hypothetical protein